MYDKTMYLPKAIVHAKKLCHKIRIGTPYEAFFDFICTVPDLLRLSEFWLSFLAGLYQKLCNLLRCSVLLWNNTVQ